MLQYCSWNFASGKTSFNCKLNAVTHLENDIKFIYYILENDMYIIYIDDICIV